MSAQEIFHVMNFETHNNLHASIFYTVICTPEAVRLKLYNLNSLIYRPLRVGYAPVGEAGPTVDLSRR
jgi:hypothetical protein